MIVVTSALSPCNRRNIRPLDSMSTSGRSLYIWPSEIQLQGWSIWLLILAGLIVPGLYTYLDRRQKFQVAGQPTYSASEGADRRIRQINPLDELIDVYQWRMSYLTNGRWHWIY